MAIKNGDRVITTKDQGEIPQGTEGTVIDASGISLIVKFDGDSSPGRLTPRDAVKVIGGSAVVAAAKKPAAADKRKQATPTLRFGMPRIARATGPTKASVSVTTEIAGQAAILFQDASVDLQTNGPLAGVCAGTIVLPIDPAAGPNRTITVDVRGAINKTAGSFATALVTINGETHSRVHSFKRVAEEDFRWRIRQRISKGTASLVLTLVIAAERRSTDATVRLDIDALDIAMR